jgi:hypothetical protein
VARTILGGMSCLPDAVELAALADRISGHAAATRARALRLGSAVGTADWRGIAASAFRAEAYVTVAGLRAAAGRLDDAADALRRHARRVAVLYADVKDVGLDGLRVLTDTVVRPDRLLADGGRLINDGAQLVGDALGLVGPP